MGTIETGGRAKRTPDGHIRQAYPVALALDAAFQLESRTMAPTQGTRFGRYEIAVPRDDRDLNGFLLIQEADLG